MTESSSGESLVAILDELTDLVAGARAMPMSASALINRAEVLELIESAKAVLPSQISQADTLVADADAVLDRARREAAKILEKARARADHLVSEECRSWRLRSNVPRRSSPRPVSGPSSSPRTPTTTAIDSWPSSRSTSARSPTRWLPAVSVLWSVPVVAPRRPSSTGIARRCPHA